MRAAAQRCLAVGFFDGVHLGHQAILRGADAALTFRRHPLEVLCPARAPKLLMSVDERVAAIRACGVADVTVLDFTAEFAQMPAADFVGFLKDTAGGTLPRVRCGENWRFGAGGAGDAAFLRARGVEAEVVGYASHRGERISSSRIRRCLAEGQVEDANAMLGRRYGVRGKVVRGKGVGRGMGYPTLNLDVGRPLNLRLGVYAVELGGARGVANYGFAPTMGERAWTTPTLEVHVLGGRDCAASPEVAVEFVRFLRPERAFASVDELRRQMAADCERARA